MARRSLLGGGDALGEVAFFTEVAQLETVRTVSVCRIMVVPRIAYNSIAQAFPIGARAILTNLLTRAQEVSNLDKQAGSELTGTARLLCMFLLFSRTLTVLWPSPKLNWTL